TVSRLTQVLDTKRLVDVSGPPASGKTTLSKLLRDHLTKLNRRVFYISNWTSLSNFQHGANGWECLFSMLKAEFPGHTVAYPCPKMVIAVDDAQLLYTDDLFWKTIIKQV
ncbi:hypothetical protein BO71DRAFT_459579, partial [Aspergillus ellipticus CBS 707.79]